MAVNIVLEKTRDFAKIVGVGHAISPNLWEGGPVSVALANTRFWSHVCNTPERSQQSASISTLDLSIVIDEFVNTGDSQLLDAGQRSVLGMAALEYIGIQGSAPNALIFSIAHGLQQIDLHVVVHNSALRSAVTDVLATSARHESSSGNKIAIADSSLAVLFMHLLSIDIDEADDRHAEAALQAIIDDSDAQQRVQVVRLLQKWTSAAVGIPALAKSALVQTLITRIKDLPDDL